MTVLSLEPSDPKKVMTLERLPVELAATETHAADLAAAESALVCSALLASSSIGQLRGRGRTIPLIVSARQI